MQVSAKSLAWDIIVGGVWGIRKACSPKIVTEWQGKGTKGTAGGRGRGDGRAEPSVVREKHYDRRSLINMNVVDNSEFTVSLKAHLEYDINYSKVICLIYIMSSLFPLSHWLYFKVTDPTINPRSQYRNCFLVISKETDITQYQPWEPIYTYSVNCGSSPLILYIQVRNYILKLWRIGF